MIVESTEAQIKHGSPNIANAMLGVCAFLGLIFKLKIKQKMNKGLTILANLNTTERMIVFVNPLENNILQMVNEKYGGSWVKVNELCSGDVLKFNSEDVYQGFDNREDDNYCQGNLEVKSFNPPVKRYS